MNRQDANDAKSSEDSGLPEPDEGLDRTARDVIGAAIEVHRRIGPGCIESIYQQAMSIELTHRRIPFRSQVPMALVYRGERIGESRLDLVVADRLVLELKAVDALLPVHSAQILSYMRIGGFHLGLLINFKVPLLARGIRRFVLSR